jgi:ATP-dependent Lhr-like helicase
MFGDLLRSLAKNGLISQSSDGAVLLDLAGLRLVSHYSFYAAFSTTEEFRLIADGKPIGSLPVAFPLSEGSYLIFAGRRWIVLSVDQERKAIELTAAAGGRAPSFIGSGGWIEDRVREEMLRVYTSTETPNYLDSYARALLAEGRDNFRRLGLGERSVVEHGPNTLIFVWKGDRVLNTLFVLLRAAGLEVSRDGLALTVQRKAPDQVMDHLKSLAKQSPSDSLALAATIANKRTCDASVGNGLTGRFGRQ